MDAKSFAWQFLARLAPIVTLASEQDANLESTLQTMAMTPCYTRWLSRDG